MSSNNDNKWIMGLVAAGIIAGTGGFVSLMTGIIRGHTVAINELQIEIKLIESDVEHYHPMHIRERRKD